MAREAHAKSMKRTFLPSEEEMSFISNVFKLNIYDRPDSPDSSKPIHTQLWVSWEYAKLLLQQYCTWKSDISMRDVIRHIEKEHSASHHFTISKEPELDEERFLSVICAQMKGDPEATRAKGKRVYSFMCNSLKDIKTAEIICLKVQEMMKQRSEELAIVTRFCEKCVNDLSKMSGLFPGAGGSEGSGGSGESGGSGPLCAIIFDVLGNLEAIKERMETVLKRMLAAKTGVLDWANVVHLCLIMYSIDMCKYTPVPSKLYKVYSDMHTKKFVDAMKQFIDNIFKRKIPDEAEEQKAHEELWESFDKNIMLCTRNLSMFYSQWFSILDLGMVRFNHNLEILVEILDLTSSWGLHREAHKRMQQGPSAGGREEEYMAMTFLMGSSVLHKSCSLVKMRTVDRMRDLTSKWQSLTCKKWGRTWVPGTCL
jgi:hypothetical protein